MKVIDRILNLTLGTTTASVAATVTAAHLPPGAVPPGLTDAGMIADACRELFGPQRGESGFVVSTRAPVPAATFSELGSGVALTTAERKVMLPWDAEYESMVNRAIEHGQDRVGREFAGRMARSGGTTAPGRAAVAEELAAVRRACKARCREISEKAAALLMPVADRMVAKVRESVDAELVAEYSACSRMGIAFVPSARAAVLVAAIDAFARARADLGRAARGPFGCSPRALAASIGITL